MKKYIITLLITSFIFSCNENSINWIEFQRDGIVRGIKDRKNWNKNWHIQMHSQIIENSFKKSFKIIPKRNEKANQIVRSIITYLILIFQYFSDLSIDFIFI